jgi:hypothetical protein
MPTNGLEFTEFNLKNQTAPLWDGKKMSVAIRSAVGRNSKNVECGIRLPISIKSDGGEV